MKPQARQAVERVALLQLLSETRALYDLTHDDLIWDAILLLAPCLQQERCELSPQLAVAYEMLSRMVEAYKLIKPIRT